MTENVGRSDCNGYLSMVDRPFTPGPKTQLYFMCSVLYGSDQRCEDVRRVRTHGTPGGGHRTVRRPGVGRVGGGVGTEVRPLLLPVTVVDSFGLQTRLTEARTSESA